MKNEATIHSLVLMMISTITKSNSYCRLSMMMMMNCDWNGMYSHQVVILVRLRKMMMIMVCYCNSTVVGDNTSIDGGNDDGKYSYLRNVKKINNINNPANATKNNTITGNQTLILYFTLK